MGCVLVVEDDDDLRDAICQVLGDDAIATAGAANGADALALLDAGLRPSLILLDLMMPVMDGWEFRRLQQADARFAAIPLLAMTASPRLDEGTLAGVEMVRKPLQLEELLERVKQYFAPQEFDAAPGTIPDGVVVAPLEISESGES